MKRDLAVGQIRTTFGVRGEVKLESFSGEYGHIVELTRMKLKAGQSVTELDVESVRMAGNLAIVKLAGIDTKEDAAGLRGAELILPRESASHREPNEFYYADLVGLDVVVAGERYGSVDAILESGGQVILDVKTEPGRRLVPFVAQFVGEVDLAAGTVEVLSPEILE